MSGDRIAAYTYQADTLCPSCVYKAVAIPPVATTDGEHVETMLDRIASDRGIDRNDERSFDSGDFPKVVFSSQLDGIERCDSCRAEL